MSALGTEIASSPAEISVLCTEIGTWGLKIYAYPLEIVRTIQISAILFKRL